MGDYGSAVSQKGYEVKTCADKFLVYSSAFQALKVFNTYAISVTYIDHEPDWGTMTSTNISTDTITSAGHGLLDGAGITFWEDTTLPSPITDTETYYIINKTTNTFQVSFTKGGSAINLTTAGGVNDWDESGTTSTVIDHNLGYLAPFILIENGSVSNIVASNGAQYKNRFKANLSWDETKYGDTVDFTVYIFLEDFRTVTETNINTGTTSGTSPDDYGLRISKAGYDVTTCADVDCVLSSSFTNLMIHKKGSGSYVLNNTIAHNLGYMPNFLAYASLGSGDYEYLTYVTNYTAINSSQILITVSSSKIYYIIFKEVT